MYRKEESGSSNEGQGDKLKCTAYTLNQGPKELYKIWNLFLVSRSIKSNKGEKHADSLWDRMRQVIAVTTASLCFHLQNTKPSFLALRAPGNPYAISFTVQKSMLVTDGHLVWVRETQSRLSLIVDSPSSIQSHCQYHKWIPQCLDMRGSDSWSQSPDLFSFSVALADSSPRSGNVFSYISLL